MNDLERSMKTLQTIVKLARRAKQTAQVSFRDHQLLVEAFIPNRVEVFSLGFSLGRADHEHIIKRLLKATDLYLEEECFDAPFQMSGKSEEFTYYAGEQEDAATGIRVRLWTTDPLWT